MNGRISRQEIYETANSIVAGGRFPKLSDIRNHLGKGSQTTIHKYFNEWKLGRFSNSDNDQSTEGLLEENQLLAKALAEQRTQVDKYSKELIQSEKSYMELREQHNLLQKECCNLQHELRDMTNLKSSFELLYQELKAERETVFEQAISDKNRLINELREELKSVNEQALAEVKTISCSAHDELMLEKVNLINAQAKVISLTERVAQLTNILNEYRQETKEMLRK